MKLIIDISEEDYDTLINHNNDKLPAVIARTNLWEAIANGTPLIDADDYVSREAVLDALKKCEPLIDYDEHDRRETYYEAEEVEFKISTLPPVYPQPKTCHWIPVSERLPEEAYGCLVTVFDTDVKTQEDFENILPYFVGYDGETWNNADGEPIPFEVIAWMPLPKPYKEG